MNSIILIPAYKPEESFVDFSAKLISAGLKVLAVDDGGGTAFSEIFARVEKAGVLVLHHEKNRGKGAALKTGFAYICEKMPEIDCIVTADCDGQHKIEDILRVIAEMEKSPDKLILGSRFSEKDVKIPLRSAMGNGITRILFFVATGLKIRDTQTGLRGIPKILFDKLLTIEGDRYEYEMNMLLQLKNFDCGFVEIPIETVYINNNEGSHYNSFKDSFRILKQILKFAFSSIVCFLIDYILFWLLGKLILPNLGVEFFISSVGLAYILARCVSAVANYIINKNFVFKKGGKLSILKYFALAIFVCIVGSFFTALINDKLGLPAVVSKLCVDLPLYVFNFYMQRDWVFTKKAKKQ